MKSEIITKACTIVRIAFEGKSYVQTLLMTTKKNSRTEREGKLSSAECCDTLLKFQNGKAPGIHGLTEEFFQGFWNLLSPQPTGSLNFSFEHGELSNSQKQAVIRLID